MIILIPIDAVLLNTGNHILGAEGVALGAAITSTILVGYQYYMQFVKYGLLGFVQLARDTQHVTVEPVLEASSEEECTSELVL